MSEDALAQAIARAIQEHRAALLARFGYVDLEVDVRLHPGTRRVALHGRVLARRLANRVADVVRPVVPEGWVVDAIALTPDPPGPWRTLARDPTELFAAIPGDGRPAALATELRVGDGPVQPIAHAAKWTLVRAIDGTLGWTDTAPGELAEAPRFAAPGRAEGPAFVRAVREYLGAPYRLGGTTKGGIDCSGLVQRALRDAGAGLVPRHSSDQLAIDPRVGPGSGDAGDLVFVWTHAEARCHVTIADGEGGLVHASRRRGVVTDARDELVAASERVRHVPWRSVVALQARLIGAATIADVLELGRPAR